MAVVPRLWLLGARPLWHDEIFTLWAARLSPGALLAALRNDSGPPLFYLLERPLALLADAAHRDVLVRLLPFGAALLLFAAVLRSTRGSERMWCLGLAASSPLFLVYSAEARAYALLALLALLLFLLLFRGEPTRSRLAAASVVAAAALWTHYLAIFLVVASALVLLWRRRSIAIIPLVVSVVLFLPWAPVLRAQPRQATSWMQTSIGASTYDLLGALGGAGRIPNPLGGPFPTWMEAAAALIGLALLVGVASAGRRDRETADAAAVALITMALVFLASLTRPVAFPGRTEMAVLPIWMWAVARAASSGRAARWTAAASVLLAAVGSGLLLTAPRQESTPSRAVAFIERVAVPTDRVIAAAAFYLPARLAHDRGELAATLISFPPDLADHPGWIAQQAPSERDFRSLEDSLAALAPGERAFLLLHPLLRSPRVDGLLTRTGAVRVLAERSDAVVLVCTAGR